MIITSIALDGLILTDGNYYFHLSGLQDFSKDVVTNDLFTDGEAWGTSKNKPKTLVLDGYILSGGVAAEWALNRVLAWNGLKTLVINNEYQCQVEVTSRGSNADNSHVISCQLTMPDPYWYATVAKSITLGATYNSGVVFGPGQGVIFDNNMFDLSIAPSPLYNVTVSNVNVETGSITVTSTISHSYCFARYDISGLTPGANYYFSATNSKSDNAYCQINNTSNAWLGQANSTFTAPADGIIEIYFRATCATAAIDTVTFTGVQLQRGTFATKFTKFITGSNTTFGTSTGGGATLTNDGNADTYPVVTIVGTCSGISVQNTTTGESISVSASLTDSDTLVIDCRPDTCGVYLNGAANIGLKTTPGWMRCIPGDNQFVFSRNSLQNKKHCTVEIRERWI